MIEPVSTARFTSAQQALEALLGKTLPPLPSVYKRPKNTPIKLIKETNKIIIDIPSTLLNSPQSFWLGLAPLFGSVFSLVIIPSLISQFIESTFGIVEIFSIFSIIPSIQIAISIWLIAARNMLFSSAFRTRIEIMSWYEIQLEYSLLNFLSTKKSIYTGQNMPKVSFEQYQFLFWKFPGFYCTFKTGSKKAKFGLFLSRDEKAWLIDEIHMFIEACQNDK